MKNVLIIYRSLPHYRVNFYNLLRDKLFERNIELHLVYAKSKNEDALKKDEVEIEWAKYIPYRRIRIGNYELLWQPYLKQIRDKDLIIVESANRLLLNYLLMFLRHFLKFKLAFWGHGRNMQIKVNSFRNKFKNLFLKKCDWWFAYTLGVRNILIEKKFPGDKVTVVQNAIDTKELQKYYNEISNNEINELKSQLGISGDNIGIFCGGMYPEKRLDFILEACHKIKSNVPDFQMLFLGSGIESVKVSEASEKYKWIHFLGPKFGNDRVIYFKLASLQIMPGLFGLAILDSFAMECPIVTTDFPFHSPEIEYLINDYNGIMTENNIMTYSGIVSSLLQDKTYLKLVEGCKQSAHVYTVDTMTENFKNGIISCLNLLG
jgi:glycosyltransferase involved in cell wall biosynthesis